MQYACERNSQTGSNGVNTKKATKRRKRSKPPGRVTNPTGEVVKQVARIGTDCIVADPETEKRLNRYIRYISDRVLIW